MIDGEAGKGDTYRPVNKERFDRHFDRIFRKGNTMKTTALTVALEGTALPKAKAQLILDQFQTMFSRAAEYETKASAIQVTDASQTDLMKQAREVRLELKQIRVNTENRRKDLKQQSLMEGKAIDGMANIIKALVIPLEAHLQQQEDFIKIQEAERIAQLTEDRKKALEPYGRQDTVTNLGSMSDEAFNLLLTGVKQQHLEEQERIAREKAEKEEADRAAEEDRIRQQKELAEAKRVAAEKEKELEAERQKYADLQKQRRPRQDSQPLEAVLTISMIQKIADQWYIDQNLHISKHTAVQAFIDHLKAVTP